MCSEKLTTHKGPGHGSMWACLAQQRGISRGGRVILSRLEAHVCAKSYPQLCFSPWRMVENCHSGVMDIDGYEIGEIAYLRHGGPLWAAHDTQGRPVLISFHAAQEGQRNEGRWRQWASINSPHVATLVDVVRHEDGRWALVQERVEGESLALLLADGGMREKVSRHRIYQGICEGVEVLHRAGMIHGDLSPHNIIVAPGQRAVIIDLCDDPTTLAGTEGWSSTDNPSKEADIDAVEKIREALLSAEGTGEIPDPATRLRLHAALAVTEVRSSTSHYERLKNRLMGRQRRHSRGMRRLLPLGMAVIATVCIGGGAWIIGIAGRSSADGLRMEGASSETVQSEAVPNLPTSTPGEGMQSHTGRTSAVQSDAIAQSSADSGSVSERCAADELSERVTQILRARDEAFNQANGAGLEQYLDGELLADDTRTIQQMNEQKVSVSGFQTNITSLAIRRCDARGVQVELTVNQSGHQRCLADSCTTMPGGKEQQVILDLQGPELKGIRAQ